MRRISTWLCVMAGAFALGGSARGQLLGGSAYGGAAFGAFGQPDGLYTSVTVPGMGRGGPGLMLYFPSTGGSSSFTPTPLSYDVAGVQVPVVGTSGSVYLPRPGAPVAGPLVAGGGLGLPSPPPPVRRAVADAPDRPASTRKAAAKAAPRADAPKAEGKPAGARSTLRERRGIR
jgi:hypothetical protein